MQTEGSRHAKKEIELSLGPSTQKVCFFI